MDNFSLSLKIPVLPSVVENVKSAGCVVSSDFPGRKREDLEVFGILGNDLLLNFVWNVLI